ncbi:MAG: undecaprenyl/decaprenyl-phosphate alpha-N-acetylglucosaminyl 1-phosphate transferase [Actinomycetota bacterium]|nr:undecaprenyl/decaprenyl-phosphate alpha-N-acetylglucosaminyl 1-phosphate transferase [Actinomycetota bacterium]
MAVGIAASAAFAVAWGLPTGVAALLFGAVGAITLGLADDRLRKFTLRPTYRLAFQVGIATLAWFSGLRADTDGPVGAVGTILFLVAAMNAFNLLDNMDGVAGTTAAATSAGIAVVALMGGQYMVASMAAALCGASVGFLPFNIRNARIYLGNGGSLLLGFLIGGAALKLRLPLEYPWPLIAIVAILAVPVTDTAVVMISRFLHSRPVMQGGVDHVSHRLVVAGLTPLEAALTHGGAALLGAGSVAQAIFDGSFTVIAVTIAAFAAAGLLLMGVNVYGDALLSRRRRFALGVALLCGLVVFTTTTPVLASLR